MEGRPRIVEQVYLGPKERVLEEIKHAYSRGEAPGPSSLRKIQVKEFGASAWLWHWAQKLGLAEMVDRHVPAVEAKRRTQLSVGQYLVIATLNRAIEAPKPLLVMGAVGQLHVRVDIDENDAWRVGPANKAEAVERGNSSRR
ncbi:MAG: hypothetical protein ACRD1R_06945, partial [Acidobacteriota bacterium]